MEQRGERLGWHHSPRGFTLLELMIVIAIIGILAAIALAQYSSYRALGYDRQALSDAKNFYSSAALAVAHGNTEIAFDAANPPPGYTGAPPVSGGFVFRPGQGITCNAVFRHPNGGRSYTLDNDGNISESN